jgi:peptidoglycan/xylan/chitin deacetylase (PgdA/CDA1 family)
MSHIRSAKYLVSSFLHRSGLIHVYLKSLRKNSLCILLYHRISNDEDPIHLSTPPDHFDQQLRLLKKYYHVMELSQAITRLSQGSHKPLAAITFDDGYLDNYTDAYPLLRKHGLPATIFLTCDYVDQKSIPWPEILRGALTAASVGHIDLTQYGLGHFHLNSLSARICAIRYLNETLKRISEKKKISVIKAMEKLVAEKSDSRRLMLNWKEVKEMLTGGVCFGSHTVTHPILTRVSQEDVNRELFASKQIIESNIGEGIESLAYPNGQRTDFDKFVKECAKAAGYRNACTTISGYNTGETHPFELKRFCIHPGVSQGPSGRFSASMFLMHISGILSTIRTRWN